MEFPKNTGMGCHFLLQEIFPTRGLNLHPLRLLHHRWILYQLSHQGLLWSSFSEWFFFDFLKSACCWTVIDGHFCCLFLRANTLKTHFNKAIIIISLGTKFFSSQDHVCREEGGKDVLYLACAACKYKMFLSLKVLSLMPLRFLSTIPPPLLCFLFPYFSVT